jgi:hypothetical protein
MMVLLVHREYKTYRAANTGDNVDTATAVLKPYRAPQQSSPAKHEEENTNGAVQRRQGNSRVGNDIGIRGIASRRACPDNESVAGEFRQYFYEIRQ